MSSLDLIIMALRNLFKRKLRTILTVSGVTIGTTAIVIMVSLGLGVNAGFDEMTNSMGNVTIIEIYNYNYYYDGTGTKLDDNSINQMLDIPGVTAASPFLDTYMTAKSGKYTAGISIYGVYPGALEAFGWVVQEGGRTLTGEEKMEVVYGYNVYTHFMSARERNQSRNYYYDSSPSEVEPNVDVLNDKVQASFVDGFGGSGSAGSASTSAFKPYSLNGVGVFSTENSAWETSYYCFMSIDDVRQIIKDRDKYYRSQGSSSSSSSSNEDDGYNYALVKCDDIDSVEAVTEAIVAMGYTNYYSPMEYVNSMKSYAGSLQMLLGAIGGVAFLVAAIGIANTMVMSIYERTREIGVMKVLGASIKDILMMFLAEAGIIGILGGVFGIAMSKGLSYVINNIGIAVLDQLSYGGASDTSIVPLWLCLVGVAFSFCVGVISGLFPAARATKISALTAIRTE